VQQVSIEAAQPNLDLAPLASLVAAVKTIMVGVLNLGDMEIETPDVVPADPTCARYVPPDRLVAAPDCGMKYLPREVAIAKLRAMVQGGNLVRAEL
jgi:5-methyltetrahydropteroyltriglutamate--homocysteine methyltransferase